jgi:hypothetical protein
MSEPLVAVEHARGGQAIHKLLGGPIICDLSSGQQDGDGAAQALVRVLIERGIMDDPEVTPSLRGPKTPKQRQAYEARTSNAGASP